MQWRLSRSTLSRKGNISSTPRQLISRPFLQQASEQEERRSWAPSVIVVNKTHPLVARTIERLRSSIPVTQPSHRLLKDSRPFYSFHQMYGHSTYSCYRLMDKIHRAVQYHQSHPLPWPTQRGPIKLSRSPKAKGWPSEKHSSYSRKVMKGRRRWKIGHHPTV